MNSEPIVLRMTQQEADSLAYVLMSALHKVTMLDRERTDTTAAANDLFAQLGYGHRTNSKGDRVEDCEHPGVFAGETATSYCGRCRKEIPIIKL